MGFDDDQKRPLLWSQVVHMLLAGQPQAVEEKMPAADAPLPSWGGARRGKRASQAYGASSCHASALPKRSSGASVIHAGLALYSWGSGSSFSCLVS